MNDKASHVCPLSVEELEQLDSLLEKVLDAQGERPQASDVAAFLICAHYAAHSGIAAGGATAKNARDRAQTFANSELLAEYGGTSRPNSTEWAGWLEVAIDLALESRAAAVADGVAGAALQALEEEQAEALLDAVPRMRLRFPVPALTPTRRAYAVPKLARAIAIAADDDERDPFAFLGRETLKRAGFERETVEVLFNAIGKQTRRAP